MITQFLHYSFILKTSDNTIHKSTCHLLVHVQYLKQPTSKRWNLRIDNCSFFRLVDHVVSFHLTPYPSLVNWTLTKAEHNSNALSCQSWSNDAWTDWTDRKMGISWALPLISHLSVPGLLAAFELNPLVGAENTRGPTPWYIGQSVYAFGTPDWFKKNTYDETEMNVNSATNCIQLRLMYF